MSLDRTEGNKANCYGTKWWFDNFLFMYYRVTGKSKRYITAAA